jgi:hypothetical protein
MAGAILYGTLSGSRNSPDFHILVDRVPSEQGRASRAGTITSAKNPLQGDTIKRSSHTRQAENNTNISNIMNSPEDHAVEKILKDSNIVTSIYNRNAKYSTCEQMVFNWLDRQFEFTS